MILRRFLRISKEVNRLSCRSYYSENVRKVYFTKINDYITQLDQSNDDSANFKILLDEYKAISSSIADLAKETSPDNNLDKELLTLMNEERSQLELQKTSLIDRIFNEIYDHEQQRDSERISGDSDCIFEISAGVGGKEAMLFADELCTMYSNYFNYKNWEIESVQTDSDGMYLRHFKATVKGQYVWDHLRYEIGVHRVQRIPKTESKGR